MRWIRGSPMVKVWAFKQEDRFHVFQNDISAVLGCFCFSKPRKYGISIPCYPCSQRIYEFKPDPLRLKGPSADNPDIPIHYRISVPSIQVYLTSYDLRVTSMSFLASTPRAYRNPLLHRFPPERLQILGGVMPHANPDFSKPVPPTPSTMTFILYRWSP